jgi:LVIVD repeat
VTNIALAADVTVVGQTAFVAADIDGLDIFDISNPASPALLSKTALSRIDPFYNDNPMSEALSVAANNGLIYVGTLNDNGIVFGLDCTNLVFPRIVSIYAYGDFIETWVGVMLFSGSDIFVGGSLGFTYPFTQADISQPYDNIDQDFPPLGLQSIPPVGQVRRSATGVRLGGHSKSARFPKSVPKPVPPGTKTISRFSGHGGL